MFPGSLKTQPAGLRHGCRFAHRSASDKRRGVHLELEGKCVKELVCSTRPQMAARGDAAILLGFASYFDGSEES